MGEKVMGSLKLIRYMRGIVRGREWVFNEWLVVIYVVLDVFLFDSIEGERGCFGVGVRWS